ncbi:neurofilament protein [Amedibacterium intestinale]|uniref:neurofilament protein n=1 Tax=Amedibacterium intestinale TaxID=2583452 RepID=UPI0039925621
MANKSKKAMTVKAEGNNGKEEQKKITAKPEPKKITASKEPVKIAAKEEPKKLAVKQVEKIEEKKGVKSPTKKTSSKKSEVKKTTKKAAVKKTTSKKTTKKAKLSVYESWSLEECISKLQAMNVHHVYEDYAHFLLDEPDVKIIEKNIIEGNGIDKADYDFDKHGYDKDLVMVTLNKVADTMDIKAKDFKEIKKQIGECVKFNMTEDVEVNSAQYLKEFRVCEKILMIGQRKHISTAEEVGSLLGSDIDQFMQHFFKLAYDILPGWQYNDVKFYEDFAFAVLSQYSDLYTKYQLNILLDVADLYIKHGDFQHGDECYGYILRDNQIKDYIYYRFASVYEPIDLNKAKSLAYESLQFVDGRYTYYQNIMDIIKVLQK